MEELIEKIKSLEPVQIIMIVLLVGAIGYIGYGVFRPSKEEVQQVNTTEIIEFPEDKKGLGEYETKFQAYEIEEEKESALELKFDENLFNSESSNTQEGDSFYQEEKDEKSLEMQRQIKLLEQKRLEMQDRNPGIKKTEAVVSTAQKKERTPEEIELEKLKSEQEYYELLKKTRSEMVEGNGSATSNTLENAWFPGAIYHDQFILPGDRVKFILTEEMVYGNHVFPKNTIVYATAGLNKSRVLLKISNINHVPVSVDIRDYDDGDSGLYNERAGELFREFQSDLKQNTVREVGREISNQVNVPIIGPTVRAFTQFFGRRRYKESDKILLVNDHLLKIYPTPQN